MHRGWLTWGLACWILSWAGSATADDGLWLFNHPPYKVLKEKYQFEPSQAWLDHLRLCSIRLNSGGSGSFISADGLVMTNHHVGADALHKISGEGKNYIKLGFEAKTLADELKCHDLEMNVLVSIEDVTDRVNAAVKPGSSPADAQQERRAIMNTIESESQQATGLRSDVVTLFQGGKYHLYRYKKYTDVRLVFAPEQDIAFFGGDPDNFEYPRWNLDVTFFRVYENGQPAKIEHFLKWNEQGCKEGDLVFVSGHPGRTDRLNTMAHLRLIRDRIFPCSLATLKRREVLLGNYSERSSENLRKAQDDLFTIKNTRKARNGALAGLQDPKLMEQKQRAEDELRKQVAADPKLASCVTAWDEIETATKLWNRLHFEYYFWEGPGGFNSELFHIARDLVRQADEEGKPNAERLREYRESNRESLEFALFSSAPIPTDLEILKLTDSLSAMLEIFGSDDALLRELLAGRSPHDRAVELVQNSKLVDVNVRKQLSKGGLKAIGASDDPMLKVARLVDERARKVRKTYEVDIEEPLRQAYAKIAQAQLAVGGDAVYPDATFTLRLSFGTVTGYQEDGKPIPALTQIGGAYQHAQEHESRPPFELPERWMRAKDKLNLKTPFNYVTTADIIGGNSGSPTVNRDGELVGIIFDGNLQSLVADFVYTEEQCRSMCVHSAGILESLRNVYQATSLVTEITTGHRPQQ